MFWIECGHLAFVGRTQIFWTSMACFSHYFNCVCLCVYERGGLSKRGIMRTCLWTCSEGVKQSSVGGRVRWLHFSQHSEVTQNLWEGNKFGHVPLLRENPWERRGGAFHLTARVVLLKSGAVQDEGLKRSQITVDDLWLKVLIRALRPVDTSWIFPERSSLSWSSSELHDPSIIISV